MGLGRRWLAAVLVTAAVIGLQALLPASASAATSSTDVCLSDPEGELVRLSGDEAGVPYLLVHGWLSTALEPTTGAGLTSSPFSRAVLWADGAGAPASETSSLQARLAALPDAAVYAFDYSSVSSDWVVDSGVSDRLGAAIACLSQRSGHSVSIVAHSMGGLAVRAALADEPDLAAAIRQVVTVGTPNLGSDAAIALEWIVDGTQSFLSRTPIVGMALSGFRMSCVKEITADARTGCDVPAWLRTAVAGTAPGGKALRADSEEIAALAPWPDEVDVHAISGSASVRVRIGDVGPWIVSGALTVLRATGVPIPALIDRSISLGDGMVGEQSAIAGADTSTVVRCESLVDASGLVGLRDTVAAFASASADPLIGACAHDSLFQNDAVVSDILAQFTSADGRTGEGPRLPE